MDVAMQTHLYHVEPAEQLLIQPLDMITLIYHRRSGVTHMVVEPVPQILAALGRDMVDAPTVVARLAASFDLGDNGNALDAITARLEELAELGLVNRAGSGA
jgi:PqqD family protein of HPr-rel-A system